MALIPGNPENYTIDTVMQIITNAAQLAFSIVGGVAVIYLIIGAFHYLTAYGDEEKATNGKKTITWAIIGLLVIVASKLIIATIWSFITDVPLSFPF